MHGSDDHKYEIEIVVLGKDWRKSKSQNDDADQLCERDP